MAMTPQQFVDRIEEIIKRLQGDELLTQAALIVLGYAQKRARVRTGTLRRSITYRVERDQAFVGTSVGYAIYQPEPFLELGLEDAQADIQELMKRFGNEILGAVGG